MSPDHTPGGQRIHRGPQAQTFHEVLALVAAGRIVCPLNGHVPPLLQLPRCDAVAHRRRPLTEWALVLPAGHRPAPHVQAFINTARTLGARRVDDHTTISNGDGVFSAAAS